VHALVFIWNIDLFCCFLYRTRPYSSDTYFINTLYVYIYIYIHTHTHTHTHTHFIFLWLCDPTWVMTYSFMRFVNHTQRRTRVGRTPLDEWSARRRDLCLTTHKHKCPRRDSNSISEEEQPQTYALDRAATRTDERTVCGGVKLISK